VASWLAAIAALPKIIEAGLQLIRYFEKTFGPDWEAKLNSIVKAHNLLEIADTDEERLKALRAIIAARRR